MKKLLYIIPAILAVATAFTACKNTRHTTTTRTTYYYSTTSYGYAPSNVAGRVIKCGNIRYNFNAGSNSFYYRGSLIRYVKTGRNTASIYDYDDNLHHRITFTSSSGGYTAAGRSVYMY